MPKFLQPYAHLLGQKRQDEDEPQAVAAQQRLQDNEDDDEEDNAAEQVGAGSTPGTTTSCTLTTATAHCILTLANAHCILQLGGSGGGFLCGGSTWVSSLLVGCGHGNHCFPLRAVVSGLGIPMVVSGPNPALPPVTIRQCIKRRVDSVITLTMQCCCCGCMLQEAIQRALEENPELAAQLDPDYLNKVGADPGDQTLGFRRWGLDAGVQTLEMKIAKHTCKLQRPYLEDGWHAGGHVRMHMESLIDMWLQNAHWAPVACKCITQDDAVLGTVLTVRCAVLCWCTD